MTTPTSTPPCPRCNRLHRRAQLAEAALLAVDPERLERAGQSGGCLGRTFLRAYAAILERQRDDALDRGDQLAEALAGDGETRAALGRWWAMRRRMREEGR